MGFPPQPFIQFKDLHLELTVGHGELSHHRQVPLGSRR